MSLVKWEPMNEMARLRDEMDRLFGRMFGETTLAVSGHWVPSVDVQEEGNTLTVKADLPGISKENIDLTATEDSLTIEGKTTSEKEDDQNGYHRRERHSGHFLRSIALPSKVDATKAEAVFKDGTVTITFPKVAGAGNGQKITLS